MNRRDFTTGALISGIAGMTVGSVLGVALSAIPEKHHTVRDCAYGDLTIEYLEDPVYKSMYLEDPVYKIMYRTDI